MADESPFKKKFVEESDKADLPGVLDQLSLPPAFIEFVRVNQKAIKIALIVIMLVVVAWSLYDSYRTSRLDKSASALYNSLSITGNEQKQALEKVTEDYSGTPASIWAQIELAHADLKNEQFSTAVDKYSGVRKSIKISSPLYPLVSYGIARALEADKKYEKALVEFEGLKGLEGFEVLSTLSIARIHELEGRKDKALEVLEQYLTSFDGSQQNNPDKIIIEEKVARIKATM